jgi:hypothetical protein
VRKKDVVVVFVDYTKAFDSVDRSALGQILRLYGVPGELAGPVMPLYKGTTATVRTPEGITEAFPTTSGILQGDTLAPFLFVVVMDYILSSALLPLSNEAFAISPGPSSLPALAFADDVAIFASSFEGAEKMIASLVAAASPVGMYLNFFKTMLQARSSLPAPMPALPAFPLIKECQDFKYLGSLMAESQGAFQERRRLAWAATRDLSPIFSSSAPEALKVGLFRAIVEPIMLYGCESWVVPQNQADHIEGAHRALLRTAINIRWPDVIRNADLYTRTGVLPRSISMREKRLIQFGKAVREEPLQQPISRVLRHQPMEGYR